MDNYTIQEIYKTNSTNPKEIEIIESANKVISLHLNKEYRQSLLAAKDFFEKLNLYLFDVTGYELTKKVLNQETGYRISNLNLKLKDKFPDYAGIASVASEYGLAYERVGHYQNERLFKYMVDHTCHFIDWFLSFCGLITNEERVPEYIEEYKNFLFNVTEDKMRFTLEAYEKSYKYGRLHDFIRVAYRAEYYCRCVKIGGSNDMFTSNILCRMAVEEFAMFFYSYITGKESQETLSDTLYEIYELNSGILSRGEEIELRALIARGNLNTHEGLSTYPFALMHSIDVLQHCREKMVGAYFKRDV